MGVNNMTYKSIERDSRRSKRVKRYLKRRKALIVCLVITLFVCFASFDVSANSNKNGTENNKTKVFVTYEVKNGDNLWSIAKECCKLEYYSSYEKYIDEVISINHIQREKIFAGCCLTIPDYI